VGATPLALLVDRGDSDTEDESHQSAADTKGVTAHSPTHIVRTLCACLCASVRCCRGCMPCRRVACIPPSAREAEARVFESHRAGGRGTSGRCGRARRQQYVSE
jgi:hypothetical protein